MTRYLVGDTPAAAAARAWWSTINRLADTGKLEDHSAGVVWTFFSRRITGQKKERTAHAESTKLQVLESDADAKICIFSKRPWSVQNWEKGASNKRETMTAYPL